jgi:phenylpyruvate tautomerase PptA (4-oxalocrotonate tautomerase family)
MEKPMPLVRVDALDGRSKDEIKSLLDAVHRAVLSAFKVPQRDRYQIYQGHPESNLIVEDTGLGIERTKNVVFVTIFSRPRTQEAKQAFYSDLCQELQASCGINPSDVVVSVVTNTDSDWSFGYGRAQFITGEL